MDKKTAKGEREDKDASRAKSPQSGRRIASTRSQSPSLDALASGDGSSSSSSSGNSAAVSQSVSQSVSQQVGYRGLQV